MYIVHFKIACLYCVGEKKDWQRKKKKKNTTFELSNIYINKCLTLSTEYSLPSQTFFRGFFFYFSSLAKFAKLLTDAPGIHCNEYSLNFFCKGKSHLVKLFRLYMVVHGRAIEQSPFRFTYNYVKGRPF